MRRIKCANIAPTYNGITKMYNYIKLKCSSNVTEQELVGWYFSGETSKIKDFLLGVKYVDYEELYQDLYK